ncbi:MAG: hypothetical protein IPJ88_13190 [Myxococcales bacterium]|nr:MAG: hypothetical protein IPJ88_13190 [Myxococcales bacterium]
MKQFSYKSLLYLTMCCGVLSACAPLSGSDVGQDSAGQGYGLCPTGQHIECGDWDSGLICNTAHECQLVSAEDALSIVVAPKRPGMMGYALHTVAKQRHLLDGQDEMTPVEALHAKSGYLDRAAEINETMDPGSSQWHSNMLAYYRLLLREEHALPLLTQEMQALDALEGKIGQASYYNSQSYFQSVAQQMVDKYERLLAQDARLEPLFSWFKDNDYHVRELESCVDEFRVSEDFLVINSKVDGCAVLYQGLIDKLRLLNDREFVHDTVFQHIEHAAQWIRQRAEGGFDAQIVVERAKDPYRFVYLRDLPIAMLGVYRRIVDPELAAQSTYAHLRMPLHVEIEGEFWNNLVNKEKPLGEWAQIAVQGLEYEDRSETERIEWFRLALIQAVTVLKENNQDNVTMLTDATITEEHALGLAMEYSGLMQLYGGYDESGQPLGFQAFHDELMAEIKAQENWAPGLVIGSSLACLGLGVATGPNPLSLGLCAAATVVGGYQAYPLYTLANTAETLSYVGLEHSLVPSAESQRVRTASNWANALVALDVLFFGLDVAAASDILGAAKAAGYVDEGVDLTAVQDDVAETTLRLGQGMGADLVDVYHDIIDLVRRYDAQIFSRSFGDEVLQLHPDSVFGFTRGDVLAHIDEAGEPGKLFIEAMERHGMPHWGFKRIEGAAGEAWKFEGAYYFPDSASAYDLVGGIPTAARTNNGAVFIGDFPQALLADGAMTPEKWLNVSSMVFSEEQLHYLDFLVSGGHGDLLLQGSQTARKLPIVSSPDQIAVLQELAVAHNVPFDELYADAIHFTTEVRADRWQEYFGYTGIDEDMLVVADDWLIEHLNWHEANDLWLDASFEMDHLDVLRTLLSDPDALYKLLPPALWQDLGARAFYQLP